MKDSKRKTRKYSIRFTVGSLFILATMLTSLFTISIQYHFSREMSEDLVLSKLSFTSSKVSEHIEDIEANASNVARLLKHISVVTEYQFSQREVKTIFTQTLLDNPMFYSIYWGNNNEDFYQIINLDSSPIVREKLNAAVNDRWVVIQVNGPKENRVRETHYYTENYTLTKKTTEESNFYPTQRPWYAQATKEHVLKTAPYLFQHLKITGQTYAVRTNHEVIGIDIVLSSVSSLISPKALGLGGELGVESFIFNNRGEIIASSHSQQKEIQRTIIPPSNMLTFNAEQKRFLEDSRSLLVSNQNDWGPLDYSLAGEPRGYSVDLLSIVSEMTGLKFEFVNGFTWQELSDKFNRGELDLLQSSVGPESSSEVDTADSVALYSMPLGIATHLSDADKTHDQLMSLPIALVKGRLTETLLEKGKERTLLFANSIDEAMQWLSTGKVTSVVDALPVLNSYRDTTYSSDLNISPLQRNKPVEYYLSMKTDDQRLMDAIALAIANVTDKQWQALNKKWLNQKLKHEALVPYAELMALTEQPALQNQMIEQDINGSAHYLYLAPMGDPTSATEYFAVIVPHQVVIDKVIPKVLTSMGLSFMILFLLLPVAWVFGNPIVRPVDLLTKETYKISLRQFDDVHHVQSRIKEVSELSDSMMDMVEEIKRYQKSQEEFVESFIRLIAQAIDEKSPYTAGHCNRVPEIGMLLADAVESVQEGKFKDFKFANDKERKEFQIAAWLHDCGKITTPEHIVDKGSKLEANYNRIHEIRTRFEVLWRDAEIHYLKQLLNGENNKQTINSEQTDKQTEQALMEEWLARQEQLKSDFEFIATSNVGSEFMGEEQVKRIHQIGQQTWQRYFDDALGLSPFEELSKKRSDQPLPVTETLLSNKPEHIIKRIRPLEFDPKFGINIEVPEHQYNLGELYNLSIRSGTLTKEDRFKINEHMISGIKMLNNLPFPPELSRVPRYASTHHETLKGTGYPRKLTRDDLSIPERILVIADIFEALTAADRPYKKAKPVSVAIDIMHKMALDDHLDIDLFMLFLESGVYKEYATRFLPEAQVDEVDIEKFRS
ncbi:HD domain-containing phosphohydrolase [Vibrio genomosp. F10]|uniref:HD domain-containing phosphohydrolase n=1 Tax=Vibrio genomosp. F10 TaxID=723171 RepID=UPI00037C1AAF|nr:HD domain-containing phosphohydrolase [Vibrio genomosp. F10]OEF06686.1 phosphohydrolase [Vibrio genomosp. F10 str. 9ZB36]